MTTQKPAQAKLTPTQVADLLAGLDTPDVVTLLTDIYKRLDAHAVAIREMRAIRDSDKPATEKVEAQPGVYVPKPACAGCGKDKHGATTALCRDCGKEKHKISQSGQTPKRYTTCDNCGASVNGPIVPFCGRCNHAYNVWRKTHK